MRPLKKDYKLITYYKFVDIENPHDEVLSHKDFCEDIGLKGRIYIGAEGINGTVSGLPGQIMAYKLYLDNHEYFHNIPDIDIKAVNVNEHQFNKLIVRYREEIVALGEKYPADEIEGAKRKIGVDEFKEVIDSQRDDYVIIDMRNNYEYNLGHFKYAKPAGTENFSDMARLIESFREKYIDKKIIMYCTGGIRCEKVAVALKRSGLEDIYQLDGGVVKYINSYDDGNWLGNMYSFDNRISVRVGEGKSHSVIGKCYYTGEPAEEVFNCRYGFCNRQIIAAQGNYEKHLGFCSEECKDTARETLYIRHMDFDPVDYKKIRLDMRDNPDAAALIKEKAQSHIDKKLANIIFRYERPGEGEG